MKIELTKKKKVVLSLTGAAVLFCLLRAFFRVCIWREDTFLNAFMYPARFFVIGILLALPTVLAVRKKKNEFVEGEEYHPFLTAKMWLVISLFYFAFLLWGIPKILETVVYQHIFGNGQTYFISSDLYGVYVMTAVEMLGIFIWLYSPKGLFSIKEKDGIVCRLTKKMRAVVAGLTAFLFCLFLCLGSLQFYAFTEKGVEVHHIGTTTYYEWSDVKSAGLYAQDHGSLGYRVTMKDGKSFSCLSNALCFTSYRKGASFTDEEGYLYYMTAQLAWEGVSVEVDDEEKLRNQLKYIYGDNVARKIQEISKQNLREVSK